MVISWRDVKIGVKINCVLKFGSHYGQSADMKKQIINLSTFIHILYSLPFLLCLGLHHISDFLAAELMTFSPRLFNKQRDELTRSWFLFFCFQLTKVFWEQFGDKKTDSRHMVCGFVTPVNLPHDIIIQSVPGVTLRTVKRHSCSPG